MIRATLALLLALPGLLFAQTKLVTPVALETINTAADETDPVVFANNTVLMYSSNAKGKFEILISRRDPRKPSAWPAGVLYYASRSGEVRAPFWHKDYVYFASSAIPDEKFRDMQNFDILKRMDEQFPIPLPGLASGSDEGFPWVALGGRELYFSRKTDKGWVLMRADGPDPGPIGKAKEVGFDPGFHRASVMTDGKFMFLEGPLEGGKIGIYKSKRTRIDGPWSKPEPVASLNHPEAKTGDQAPALSSDGQRLYFASDRPGGKGKLDVYSVLLTQLK